MSIWWPEVKKRLAIRYCSIPSCGKKIPLMVRGKYCSDKCKKEGLREVQRRGNARRKNKKSNSVL